MGYVGGMSVHENRRHLMIESQLRANKVTNAQVLDAFSDTPRETFVTQAMADIAYIDEDLVIGEGRFLLEPMVFARLVQALDLGAEDSVLDIGAASGYSTTILSRLAQSVVGIEEVESFALMGQENLEANDVDNAVILHAPHRIGFKEEAPYNAIIIEGAVESVPENLLHQLSDGGRLLTILRPAGEQGRAIRYVRSGDSFSHRVLFDANAPLLDDFMSEKPFVFGS